MVSNEDSKLLPSHATHPVYYFSNADPSDKFECSPSVSILAI